jgi:hypothetical protein
MLKELYCFLKLEERRFCRRIRTKIESEKTEIVAFGNNVFQDYVFRPGRITFIDPAKILSCHNDFDLGI